MSPWVKPMTVISAWWSSVVDGDMMMAEMDGPTLIRNLRQLAPNLPIIGMTGLSERVNVPPSGDRGALPLLTKPFTAEDILSAVHRELVPKAT